MNINNKKKGFTLVELLIVIGILAVLGTTAVVILNPAQLLAQARDGQRIQDLNSINSALALYSADVSNPSFGTASPGNCTATPATDNYPFGDHDSTAPDATCTVVTDRTVGDGAGTASGWVDVDLAAISGGSPLSSLPIDPTNDDTYLYAYAGNDTNNTWELSARLESEKHRDEMVNDGGEANTCSGDYTNNTCWYEIGTEPGLDL